MKKSIFRFITLLGIVVMVFGGVGSMAAQSGSGSCPWDEDNFVEVSSAVALWTELSTGGTGNKSIRLTGDIYVDDDITSSINATIDLNGYALNFPDVHSSINVTGGCLNIYDGSGTASSIDVNEDNAKAFVVSDGATLNIYGGEYSGNRTGTAVYNGGTVNVYGGKFTNLDMAIYNAGTLNLHAIPDFGGIYDYNLTADIGLKEGKVITMAGEISSLPEDYVKIKVGQFSYSESGGYSAAGSVPYVVTSGYKDKVKGIHPAMMFQAYDENPGDNVYFEVCAKSGSGTDVGEAQIINAAGDAAVIIKDGSQVDTDDLQVCVLQFPENANNAEIKLLRNVDLGSGFVTVDKGSATNPVAIDLNGHLLTGSSIDGVIYVNSGAGLTIRDSGSGGAIVNTNIGRGIGIKNDGGTLTVEGGSISATGEAIANTSGTLTVTGGTFTGGGKGIENDGGTLTVEGGSISATGYAISNTSGTLTVTGGTFTGGENAVYNGSQDAATISGGTLIGAAGENPAIDNDGTMELGCGSGAVTVLGGGGSSAVGNRDALTVGENVTIMSGTREGIYNAGTLTVKGFPTFDAGNACDIILEQTSDNTNTLISFNADISGGPANPIKIKIEDGYGNPVTPGTSGLTLTSGYAAHVKRGGTEADKDRPQEPGLVFTVLGVADGTYLLLSGGEAVAYAGSFPVAEVKSGDDTYTYNIGTGALGLSTAAGALVQAVYAADRVDDDTTVKMLCDVDLGTAWLDFRTFTSAVGYTPENAKKMTLDLNGFELSGCQIKVIDNSVYSLSVVNTGTDGGILQYGETGVCIANYGELTVKGVTLRATGVSGNRIYNFGTLTIDGELKFLDSVDANDVYLAYGKTLGIGESLNLSAKLKVYVEDATNVPRKLTTGYGSTMRTQATSTTTSTVIAPDEVFEVTNIGSNKLVFAGGEAWVVGSGTLALVQTGTTVNAYTNDSRLHDAVREMPDGSTVILTDNVNMSSNSLDFPYGANHFTLDLGGHEIISDREHSVYANVENSLDITDSGGGGRIKNIRNKGDAIYSNLSYVSIQDGVTIEATGTDGHCIFSHGGTLTLKGWPKFDLGENAGPDIYLEENAMITFTDDITSVPTEKISVKIYGDNLGTLTSGYGAHVKYPAGHTKQGETIDPEEVFTYKPYDTPVASVHAKLEGSDDAAEAAFWMPHQKVAYVDAAGDLHDDLTDSTPQTTDDGHDAYILDGTETTLGADGTDTWYVALPGLPIRENSGFTHTKPIELKGDVHLVLADGCVMDVGVSDNTGCIHGDATTSLTIYAQSEEDDKGKLSTHPQSDWTAGIRAGSVTINGGDLDLDGNSSRDCYGIYADGGGLTFNGGEIISGQYYGFYAVECGITVNGGNIRALKERDNGYGLSCLTTGGHTIDINGGTVSAQGDKAAIWATKDINIKSVVTAVCTGLIGYAIFSDAGDVNISGGKVTANASYGGSKGICTLNGNVIITAGQVEASGVPYGILAFHDIILSLSESTDFIKSKLYRTDDGEIKIPAGHYLGASDDEDISYLVFGSADAPYVFGVGDNAPLSNINDKTLVKATPIAGSGNYVAYDSSDGDWLLGSGTEALYPTGLKFNKDDNGQYTAEILLTTTPLAGVPQGMPLILAKKNTDDVAWTINLIGTNDNADDGYKPADIESDYTGRGDRLPNFIATDGAKSFAELIGEAAGATVSTAEQAREYLVFTLTGDRFVPITFAYDDTPAAGHCLLVIPKINILLHQGLGKGAGESSSQARRISLGGGESAATGVNGVIGVGDGKDDTYFGLDGRRLSGRPSQKGVYIRGGSKVVIK